MRIGGVRALAMLAGIAALLGCAELERPPVETAPARADVRPSVPATDRSGPVRLEGEDVRPRPETPEIYRGSGIRVRDGAARRGVSVDGGEGEITLNFVNADVREVVRTVLGDLLRLNYVVDPRVQGTITVQTSRPLTRAAVLPTLETVLRTSGVALVETDGIYRVLPAEAAARPGAPAEGGRGGAIGTSLEVIPLRFASASEIKGVVEPLIGPGGTVRADTTRNLLIVQGARDEIRDIRSLVEVFDVDWLAGMSFALHPLHAATARALVPELERIFGDAEGPAAGVLRFVPIERMNAVLVIASNATYLGRAQEWIDRLDRGRDEDTSRLHVYYVQNSRAGDIANVLAELFSSRDVRTVLPTIAPGLGQAEIRSSGLGTSSRGPSDFPDRGMTGTPLTGGGTRADASRPSPFARPPQPQLQPRVGQTGSATVLGAPGILGAPGLGSPLLGLGDGVTRPPQEPPLRIVADEKNNALVIFAKPRDYRMIEAALRRLDIVPLQVLIEATIAEVTLNDNLRYGLQWFFRSGNSSVTFTDSPLGAVNPVFPGFNYLLSGGDARLVLSALSQVTDVNVVSSPSLLVLDHQTAVLQVGDQVPIAVQQAVSVLNPDAPIVNSIQFRDTGVILRVTPRVNSTGLVYLDIDQEVSDVARTTSSDINSPTISQRRIVSTVAVQGRETVALGGLIRDSSRRDKSGVPVLSDIPVLGALFSTRTNTATRTELLVLLTPRVVRNTGEAREVTDELRDRMRAVKILGDRIR